MFVYIICVILLLLFISRVTCGWCSDKTCLVGKTAIITGGNSGIGYQAALTLASKGCRVIIADKEDASKSRDTIVRETKNHNVIVKELDLASFSSVKRFAKDIIDSEPNLHILINNAGIGTLGMQHTEDGLQKTMQVNYYGHFLLTHLLLGLLKKSSPSRIIFTGSITSFWTKLNVADMTPPENLSGIQHRMYSNSKLCMNIAAKCFAEKLTGSGVTAYSFHPGLVRTGIYWRSILENRSIWVILLTLTTWIFGKNAEEGAQTIIHLACSDAIENANGGFFSDCRHFVQPIQVYNDELCEKVWNISKKCVKLGPNEGGI
ncbi:retinol dehydrogenase 12 [Leptinotarsa decemlineata]|uniref:retinol dehydrogenase 12 n=1 Tax=Leptinotarsa decemlineata TaxID=7539 RepID=UPI000C254359|nr:retinol dehydrogenase 12-like [Leptinotarsa decemlineata]